MATPSLPQAKGRSESAEKPPPLRSPAPETEGFLSPLLSLQQVAGNEAVGSLLQTKLRIGPPNDAYEREADRVAEAVLREGSEPVPISEIRTTGAQRMCAKCQEEEDLVQPKAEGSAPRPAPGFEARVDSLRGSGRPLPAGLRSFFEPRFGHDFGAVHLHTGVAAGEAAQAVNARAFTVGNDVVFGHGEWSPETTAGKSLLAHELTHVVQQTPLARRKPILQRAPQEGSEASPEAEPESPAPSPEPSPEPSDPGEPTTETAPASQTPAAEVVVEDDATEVGEGQMKKSEFLARLRPAALAAAEAGLSDKSRLEQANSFVDLWLGQYEARDARQINRDLRRLVPGPQPTTAEGYISAIAERVGPAVAAWERTGQVPPELSQLGSELSGAGGLLGGLGGVFFKARPGGPRDPGNPVTLQTRLGAGLPLDGSIRSRMESAFGRGFGHVRVHTDGAAAGLSSGFNARAFTVGHHVAFGPQEYRPGTMIGDALIAHELAHVAQQGDAGAAGPVPVGSASYQALERDADLATASAVASLWTGLRGRMRSFPRPQARLSSGLRLQRCDRCSLCSPQQTTATPAQPTTTPQPATTPTQPATAPQPTTIPAQPATTQSPRLKFDTADKKEQPGTCGNFGWQTQWSLDRETTRGGVIVQKMDIDSEKARYCNGKYLYDFNPYWEGWEIRPNQKVTTITQNGNLHDDEWGSDPFPDSKGSRDFKGSAEFYEGQSLPPSFKVDKTSPAKDLPMTWDDPHMTGGSGPVNRELIVQWDCCPGSKGPTTLTHR